MTGAILSSLLYIFAHNIIIIIHVYNKGKQTASSHLQSLKRPYTDLKRKVKNKKSVFLNV